MRTGFVSLNAAGAMPLGGEETFQRHKQIRTQASLLAPNRVQISVFEQLRKKFLDYVLRLLARKALPPGKSKQRSPISSTEYLESFLRGRRFALRL
jgi:hypothetical protein